MVRAQTREKETATTPSKGRYVQVVVRFLMTWLLFLVLLTGTVLIMNLNWFRPQFEQMMSQWFHRQVVLGELSWTLDFNGLALATNRMTVIEAGGQPFLKSGRSEIGVAFLPLLRGNLVVRHLSLASPEVWAVRLTPQSWNFSDLLQPGPEIRFIELEGGKLHLIDRVQAATQPRPRQTAGQQSPAWRLAPFAPYDLVDVDLKLVWPHKQRRWPFYLSFKLPRGSYTTDFDLTVFGTGPIDRWQENKYHLDLKVDQLNPEDLKPLSLPLPDFKALCQLNLSGEGILANGIHGSARARLDRLVLKTAELGELRCQQATGDAQLFLDRDKIRWDPLNLRVGQILVESKGELRQWQQGTPSCKAEVAGKVQDLSEIASLLPERPRQAEPPLNQEPSAGRMPALLGGVLDLHALTGSAAFKVKADGPAAAPQLMTAIRADRLSIPRLIQQGALQSLPLVSLLAAHPKSIASGEVKIDPNGRVELPEAEIMLDGSALHLAGYWDRYSGSSRLDFAGTAIELEGIGERIQSSKELSALLGQLGGPNSGAKLSMSGRMDLSGHVQWTARSQAVTLSATLHDAGLSLRDHSFSAQGVKGQVSYGSNKLVLKQLTGTMGSGAFDLDGSIALTSQPTANIDFHSAHADLSYLTTALKLLKVQLPILAEHQLYGRVRDFTLSMSGSPRAPAVKLTAQPDELYYQPPGLSRPLKAVSGNISYDDDELVLSEVGLVSQGSKLITDLAISELSTRSQLRRIKVKTTGIELSDAHFYLSSPLMPPALRKAYLDFLTDNHLAQVRGRVYGNLLWQAKPHDDFDLDGVVGFFNVGGRVAANGWPIDHLSGIVAASGSELLLQDVSGSIGTTTFVVDGHVTNYRDSNLKWQTDLRAQVYPDQFLELVPGLADQLRGHVLSAGPLSLRATVSGNPEKSTVIFSGRAEPSDHLKLIGPFGMISQPSGQTVTLDGSLSVTQGSSGTIQVMNSNLLVGDSIIQGRGKYSWYAPDKHTDPEIEFVLTTPNPVPASTLVAALDPATSCDGVKGLVEGSLSGKGTVSDLRANGYIALEDLSLPAYNLFQVTGRIDSAQWAILSNAQGKSGASSPPSQARLQLHSATMGALTASDITADIVLEPGSSEDSSAAVPAPKVALTNGTARVAKGTLSLGGWLDLVKHQVHGEALLSKVQASLIAAQLFGQPGEISGIADAKLVLDSQGTDFKELIAELDGHGSFTVYGGKVTRFGQLQARLTQANLLQQGIFGFNLNNLLQSVVPVRTGEFRTLAGNFEIANGVLSIDSLQFRGDDMRLRAAGTINLPLKTIQLEVDGNVPRVSSSILGGPFGEVSRDFTIQKFIHFLTFHKLESLPSLPILGDIATDRPRAFVFQVIAPLDQPKLLAQSIEKTFHWLPSRPSATAHPIPGLSVR